MSGGAREGAESSSVGVNHICFSSSSFFLWNKRRGGCRCGVCNQATEQRILPELSSRRLSPERRRRRSRGRGEDRRLDEDGGLCRSVERVRDGRFKPGEHFFIMKPLAASDSNGVPSQQDKTPVSSLLTCEVFSPSVFFPPLSLVYDPLDMITGPIMDVHRISIESRQDE